MKLLVALAGFPHSEPTLRYADLVARATGAQVTVIHVAERQEWEAAGEATLAEAKRRLSGLEVNTILRRGKPTQALLAQARVQVYDLLVLGARETPSLSEVLLGSVARRVVAEAPCSVLVVRGERSALQKMLVCTGGRQFADETVRQGILFAQRTGATITLLYVAMPAASMYAGLDQVDQSLAMLLQSGTPEAEHLRRACEAMEAAQVRGELELRHGSVVEEILREANLGDYDLVVLGAPRVRGQLEKYIWGDVTGGVLDGALRPVMVVRGSPPSAPAP